MASKIPIVIAVTGHRDIDYSLSPKTILAKQCKEAIVHFIDSSFEGSAKGAKRSVCILSSLAEGADQLVAEVVLELRADSAYRNYITLVAPLPLPLAEYEQDFEGAARDKFHALLKQVDHYFVIDSHASQRPDCYAQLGAYMVRHALVLLALWDGKRNGKPGGTGEVVDFMLSGSAALQSNHHYGAEQNTLTNFAGETGCVVHIPVTRTSSSEAGLALPDQKQTHDDEINWGALTNTPVYFINHEKWKDINGKALALRQQSDFFHIIAKVDAYNAALKTVREQSYNQTSYSLEGDKLSQAGSYTKRLEANPWLKPIITHFHASDCLALQYQRIHFVLIGWLFLLVTVGFFAFDWTRDLMNGAIGLGFHLAVAVTVIAMGGGYVLRKIWQKGQYKSRFQDCRLLAEALRIAYFLNQLPDRSQLGDWWLGQYRHETLWLDYMVRYITQLNARRFDSTVVPAESRDEILKRIQRNWLEDQKHYFAGNLERKGVQSRWLLQYSKSDKSFTTRHGYEAAFRLLARNKAWLWVFALFAWGLLMAKAYVGQHWCDPVAGTWFGDACTGGLLPSWLVAWPIVLLTVMQNWFDLKGWEEDFSRYQTVHDLFAAAILELEHGTTPAETVFLVAARQAAAENMSWYTQHCSEDVS